LAVNNGIVLELDRIYAGEIGTGIKISPASLIALDWYFLPEIKAA